jgi:hypothetical protein
MEPRYGARVGQHPSLDDRATRALWARGSDATCASSQLRKIECFDGGAADYTAIMAESCFKLTKGNV